ncbi:MAG: hypothetical protein M3167_00405 [Acidobacteriota bacterium]|nr:hypothetical protein [Acidobacteriota bacterium]
MSVQIAPPSAVVREEALARSCLERLEERAYTDREWAALRRDLTTFAKLVARWDRAPVVSVAIPDQPE